MLKEVIKILIMYFLKIFFLLFRVFEIKSNRIMFVSLTGGQYMEYSCNPKYVYEALNSTGKRNYDVVWAFSNPEQYAFLKKKGVRLVKHFSVKAMYYLMTSRVVVTGGSYLPWITFRKRQIVIDTWHGGGAYKRLDIGHGLKKRLIERQNKLAGSHATVFVSSCKEFTEQVIYGAFAFRGEVLEIGMPRNDFLVKKNMTGAVAKVRKHYQIEEDTAIMLYAPTYRETGEYEKLDVQKVLKQLEEATGKKWLGFLRGHRYETEGFGKDGDGLIDVSDYADMQELLAASDLLISDYSSCIWDFSFLDRPCYLYVPDLEEYRKNRGFYVDIDRWHMPYAENDEDLLEQIMNIKDVDWHKQMEAHRKEMRACETGEAARMIVKYIEENCV